MYATKKCSLQMKQSKTINTFDLWPFQYEVISVYILDFWNLYVEPSSTPPDVNCIRWEYGTKPHLYRTFFNSMFYPFMVWILLGCIYHAHLEKISPWESHIFTVACMLSCPFIWNWRLDFHSKNRLLIRKMHNFYKRLIFYLNWK